MSETIPSMDEVRLTRVEWEAIVHQEGLERGKVLAIWRAELRRVMAQRFPTFPTHTTDELADYLTGALSMLIFKEEDEARLREKMDRETDSRTEEAARAIGERLG